MLSNALDASKLAADDLTVSQSSDTGCRQVVIFDMAALRKRLLANTDWQDLDKYCMPPFKVRRVRPPDRDTSAERCSTPCIATDVSDSTQDSRSQAKSQSPVPPIAPTIAGLGLDICTNSRSPFEHAAALEINPANACDTSALTELRLQALRTLMEMPSVEDSITDDMSDIAIDPFRLRQLDTPANAPSYPELSCSIVAECGESLLEHDTSESAIRPEISFHPDFIRRRQILSRLARNNESQEDAQGGEEIEEEGEDSWWTKELQKEISPDSSISEC